MADYVSRDDVRRFIADAFSENHFATNYDYAILVDKIDELPAADVQPVKHGRWIYPYKDKDINQCSECRSCVQDKISNVREMFAYCPFCGARMDGETE